MEEIKMNASKMETDPFQAMQSISELRHRETDVDIGEGFSIKLRTLGAEKETETFVECMNYGYVDGDDEDYDRENMSNEKLKEMYDKGVNLKDALRSFIVKVENN